jgi:hypothetical protein
MERENEPAIRNEQGQFVKGHSGNPLGRTPNSLKDYLARKLAALSDDEKEEWLKTHNIAGELQWRMGEGNPAQDTKHEGEIKIVLTQEIAEQNDIKPSTSDNSEG